MLTLVSKDACGPPQGEAPLGTHKIRDLQNHPEPFVTTSDLAEYWRVSRKQLYKQIEAGTLRAIRLGPRLLRIRTAEAIRFEETAKMSPPEGLPGGRPNQK